MMKLIADSSANLTMLEGVTYQSVYSDTQREP